MGAEVLTDWEREPDLDPVIKWRQQQLERLGFSSITALNLAGLSYVDLRKAEKLIADGCPFDQAAEILA